jgi:hypothetical protein
MKKTYHILQVSMLISLMYLLPFNNNAYGQPKPSPTPTTPSGLTSSGHGSGHAESAPSMPIGGGLMILLMLGGLYAGKKYLDLKPGIQVEK